MPFAFTPATGLSDTAAYPTTPANEAAARQQVMDPLNQIRDYMNNSLALKNPAVTWIAPTLLNGWVNFGGSEATAGYYKDEIGIVHLRGLVKSGSAGAVIFTLPAGYRPLLGNTFTVPSSNGTEILARASVNNNGQVTQTIGGATFFALDGIAFLAEQ